MNEGLDLNLVLSGATLISIGTLAVKVWQSSRAQRIGPQPFEVKEIDHSTPAKFCDERHTLIDRQSENIFCRMSAAEQRIAKVEATVVEIKDQYHSIDTKLMELLRRMP
jgi:hypothetical protein